MPASGEKPIAETETVNLFEWGIAFGSSALEMDKIANEALRTIKKYPPKLAVLLSTPSGHVDAQALEYLLSLLDQHKRGSYPAPRLIGSTVARVLDENGMPSEGVSLAVLASPVMDVYTVALDWTPGQEKHLFGAALKKTITGWLETIDSSESPYPHSEMFFFIIGPGILTLPCSSDSPATRVYDDHALVEQLNEITQYRIPVFGFSSGTGLTDFQKPACQFHQDSLKNGAFVLALVRTTVDFHVSMDFGSTLLIGEPHVIRTASDESGQIQRIGDRDAQDFISKKLGSKRIAVVVDERGTLSPLVSFKTGRGGITFNRSVADRSVLYVHKPSPIALAQSAVSCVRNAGKAKLSAGSQRCIGPNDFVFFISCSGRLKCLGEENQNLEMELIRQNFPNNRVFGCYGAGEFGVNDRNTPVAHNWFCTALVLKQQYTPAALSRARETRAHRQLRAISEIANDFASIKALSDSEQRILRKAMDVIEETVKCQLVHVFLHDENDPQRLTLFASNRTFTEARDKYRENVGRFPEQGGNPIEIGERMPFQHMHYSLDGSESEFLTVSVFSKQTAGERVRSGSDPDKGKFHKEWQCVFPRETVAHVYAVPILIRKDRYDQICLGVIVLTNHQPDPEGGNLTGRFDKMDKEFLSRLATLLGESIAKIRVRDTGLRQNYFLGNVLSRALSTHDLIRSLLKNVCELTGAEGAGLFLKGNWAEKHLNYSLGSHPKDAFYLVATTGSTLPKNTIYPIEKPPKTVTGWVINNRILINLRIRSEEYLRRATKDIREILANKEIDDLQWDGGRVQDTLPNEDYPYLLCPIESLAHDNRASETIGIIRVSNILEEERKGKPRLRLESDGGFCEQFYFGLDDEVLLGLCASQITDILRTPKMRDQLFEGLPAVMILDGDSNVLDCSMNARRLISCPKRTISRLPLDQLPGPFCCECESCDVSREAQAVDFNVAHRFYHQGTSRYFSLLKTELAEYGREGRRAVLTIIDCTDEERLREIDRALADEFSHLHKKGLRRLGEVLQYDRHDRCRDDKYNNLVLAYDIWQKYYDAMSRTSHHHRSKRDGTPSRIEIEQCTTIQLEEEINMIWRNAQKLWHGKRQISFEMRWLGNRPNPSDIAAHIDFVLLEAILLELFENAQNSIRNRIIDCDLDIECLVEVGLSYDRSLTMLFNDSGPMEGNEQITFGGGLHAVGSMCKALNADFEIVPHCDRWKFRIVLSDEQLSI